MKESDLFVKNWTEKLRSAITLQPMTKNYISRNNLIAVANYMDDYLKEQGINYLSDPRMLRDLIADMMSKNSG